MVLLVMFVLIFVASGLIGVFFGLGALVGSLPCLGGGALLIGLIWAAFTLAERAAS